MPVDQATLPIQAPSGADVAYADAAVADTAFADVPAAHDRRPLVDLLLRVANLKVILSVGAGFTVFFLNAVQGAILARMLGPTLRGEYGTAVFFTQTLTFAGLLGTQLAIARRASNAGADLSKLMRAALRLGFLTSLVTIAAVSLLALFTIPADKRALIPLCIACSLFLPAEHMRLSVLAIDHGAAQFTRFNIQRVFAALVLPVLFVVAWISGYVSLQSVLTLFVLAPLVPLVVLLASHQCRVWGPSSPPTVTLVKEGLPFAAGQMAAELVSRLDVFLILLLATFAVQGYYAAAVPAAGLLMIGPQAIALFAFNAGARRDAAPSKGRLAATVGALAAFQLLTAVSLAMVVAPLMVLVYGAAFRDAVPFALVLMPACALNGCTVVAEGYFQGRGEASVGIRSRLCGAVVMLILVAVLFPTWRELSIPMAAIGGQAINATGMLWALTRRCRTVPSAITPSTGLR
jgi:enterobacterial common antigen flippase